MYNLQLIEERIMTIAKEKGLSKNKLLMNAKLHKGVFDNMKKGQIPSVDKIHIIANYLDCSVDYLLGRTDEPTHYINNSNVTQGDSSIAVTGSVIGSDSITANNESKNILKEESEILDIYRSLNICDKSTFLNFILDMKKEKSC